MTSSSEFAVLKNHFINSDFCNKLWNCSDISNTLAKWKKKNYFLGYLSCLMVTFCFSQNIKSGDENLI